MKCKLCGHRLADGAVKCPICGAMPGSTKAGNIAKDANLPRYFCPSCKAEIIGEHRYCPSCMKDLSQAPKKQEVQELTGSKCVQCGAHLPVGAKFCHACGAKQEAANVSPGLNETPLKALKYEKRGRNYILRGRKDTSLKDIVIPSVFSTIGRKAFWGCRGLKSITIPDSVTEIGGYAFSDCSGLTSITIPSSVTKIGVDAFANCSGLTSITIPNSVTEIGNSAFSGCSGLTSITIPSSVTEIGDSAFSSCSGLTSIIIPNSVTEIGNSAFANCSCLTSITIPSSVTEIGDKAFAKCISLKNILIENPNFKKSNIKHVFRGSLSFAKIKIGNEW